MWKDGGWQSVLLLRRAERLIKSTLLFFPDAARTKK